VRRATSNNRVIHVPAILLSAGAEFDLAYGAGRNLKPELSHISENDPRAKSSSWYQPPIYALHPPVRAGMLQTKFICY
jgi:hypothetical protein